MRRNAQAKILNPKLGVLSEHVACKLILKPSEQMGTKKSVTRTVPALFFLPPYSGHSFYRKKACRSKEGEPALTIGNPSALPPHAKRENANDTCATAFALRSGPCRKDGAGARFLIFMNLLLLSLAPFALSLVLALLSSSSPSLQSFAVVSCTTSGGAATASPTPSVAPGPSSSLQSMAISSRWAAVPSPLPSFDLAAFFWETYTRNVQERGEGAAGEEANCNVSVENLQQAPSPKAARSYSHEKLNQQVLTPAWAKRGTGRDLQC